MLPGLASTSSTLSGFPARSTTTRSNSTTQALHYLREPNVVATFIKAFL